MKNLSALLVLAALALSSSPSAGAAEVLQTVHWCKDTSGRVTQRVDGCRVGETDETNASAQPANAQATFDRVTQAYAAASNPVAASAAEAREKDAKKYDADMHRAHMGLLRTFAFCLAGGLFFKLLLRRSFWIGFLVGFLVECVLVGAAVMN